MRAKRLTANAVPSSLAQLRRDVDEMKTNQQVTAENLRLYLSTTTASTPGDDYGLQNVNATVISATSLFVRFTSREPFHFADLTYKVLFDGIELHPGDDLFPFVTDKQRLVSAPNAYEKWWQLSVVGRNVTPDTLTFQFYVQSTSPGDFRL